MDSRQKESIFIYEHTLNLFYWFYALVSIFSAEPKFSYQLPSTIKKSCLGGICSQFYSNNCLFSTNLLMPPLVEVTQKVDNADKVVSSKNKHSERFVLVTTIISLFLFTKFYLSLSATF